MKIVAVCTGSAEKLAGKSYRTGIFKQALAAPVMIDRLGLVGDAVCNKKHHGGPDQAVLIYGAATLDWWRADLGHDLPFGTFGENLVIAELDNRDVAVGDRFSFGEVVLEATTARMPCATLAARMGDSGFVKRYQRAARPGIYARVLAEGFAKPGMAVAFIPYPGERISMAEIMAIHGRITESERARFLAAPIAGRLRAKLTA